VSGNEIGFFVTMDRERKMSRAEAERLYHDKDAIRSMLTERFNADNGWCPLIDTICRTADPKTIFTWPFYVTPPLPTWSSESGRVLILGDAAHAMIPTGGLGASLAFEDAECLAHVLQRAAESNFDIETIRSMLEMWQEHRSMRLQKVQDFTNLNRRMRKPGGSWLVQTIKEWYIWLVLKVVGTGSLQLAKDIYEYDTKEFEDLLRVPKA